jgi:hypothetical protein
MKIYYTPEGVVTLHGHKSEEIIVCLEGQIEIEIKGVKSIIKQGDTAIIPQRMYIVFVTLQIIRREYLFFPYIVSLLAAFKFYSLTATFQIIFSHITVFLKNTAKLIEDIYA